MPSDRKTFKYSRSDRLTTLILFLLAFFIPIWPALIGFVVVVAVPPRMDLHEAISRLTHFIPDVISRNPPYVLFLILGLWLFFLAATLPKMIAYSLVISINEEGIDAVLFGIRTRHLPWREVKQIEGGTVLEYSRKVYGQWETIKIIKIRTQKRCLVIRETI